MRLCNISEGSLIDFYIDKKLHNHKKFHLHLILGWTLTIGLNTVFSVFKPMFKCGWNFLMSWSLWLWLMGIRENNVNITLMNKAGNIYDLNKPQLTIHGHFSEDLVLILNMYLVVFLFFRCRKIVNYKMNSAICLIIGLLLQILEDFIWWMGLERKGMTLFVCLFTYWSNQE